MLHVNLSRVREQVLGRRGAWEEVSVFSQVEVSEGSREDGRIPGSLEVPDSREMGAGKTHMQRSLPQPTLTLCASS